MPRNKNGLKPIALEKHKLNTPGQNPFLTELKVGAVEVHTNGQDHDTRSTCPETRATCLFYQSFTNRMPDGDTLFRPNDYNPASRQVSTSWITDQSFDT